MGPTKVIVKDGSLFDAKTGKLIKEGLTTHKDIEDYAKHHYIVLPVVDKPCQHWTLDGQPVYCLQGSRFKTVKNEVVRLARCPDCGGMGIRDDEPIVESDCIRCVKCGHEFDARLEMMKSYCPFACITCPIS